MPRVGDPAWFYSSLAQVSAAIVGFFGGFLILRLLNQMSEWRQTKSQLDATQNAWYTAKRALEDRRKKSIAVLPDQEMEENRLWNELVHLIQARQTANIPPGLGLGTVVLAVLAAVGIVWPLLALDAPDDGRQMLFVIPWSVLLLLFMGLMYWRANGALKELREVRLWDPVDREYENYMAQVESELAKKTTPGG